MTDYELRTKRALRRVTLLEYGFDPAAMWHCWKRPSMTSTSPAIAAVPAAAELELIDGCCIGDLTAQQMRAWLCETAETVKAARWRGFQQPGKEEP